MARSDKTQIILEAVGAGQVQNAIRGVESQVTGLVGAFAGLASVAAIGDFFKESIKAAAESEKSYARLAATVNRLGGIYSLVQHDVEKFTSHLQAQSQVTDEEAADALNRLFIATKDMSLAMRAASVAADVAAGTDMEYSSVVNLLTRSTAGSIEVFKRYGIVINEADFNARGLNSILDTLNKQFGGAAAANTDTLAGAVHQLSVQWGELQEAVGRKFGGKTLIQGMAEGFAELSVIIDKSKTPIIDLMHILTSGANAGLVMQSAYLQVLKEQEEAARRTIPMVGEIIVRAKALHDMSASLAQVAINKDELFKAFKPDTQFAIHGGPKSIDLPGADESSAAMALTFLQQNLRRQSDAYDAHYQEIQEMTARTAQHLTELMSPVTDAIVAGFMGMSVDVQAAFKDMISGVIHELVRLAELAIFKFLISLVLPGSGSLIGPGIGLASGAGGATFGGLTVPAIPSSSRLSGGSALGAPMIINVGGSQRSDAVLATMIASAVVTASRYGQIGLQSAGNGPSNGLERSIAFNLGVAS